MEAVGLLEIVELTHLADEIADRKHALLKHCKEDVVRNQPRHSHRLPPGARLEHGVELVEIGHSRLGQAQEVDAVEEWRHDPRAE